MSTTLNVAIVGAGLAGLAASISLTRSKHNVNIYERSLFKNEAGAAINVSPNGALVLQELGLNLAITGGARMHWWKTLKAGDCGVMSDVYLGDVEKEYGFPMLSFHRADLHSGLKALAEESGVKIHLGAEVVDLGGEKGSLRFKDGKEEHADLIVLADGCHAKFMRYVEGESFQPLVKTRQATYRGLVPMSSLLADDETRPLFNPDDLGYYFTANPKTHVLGPMFPCRNGSLLNWAMAHPLRSEEEDSDDWNASARLEDVLEALDGFHPALKKIPTMAKEGSIKFFTNTTRTHALHLTRGKTVAIGDAAHHIRPVHGQGAMQCFEDAAALGVLLGDLQNHGEIPLRLAAYEKLRLPRTGIVHALSEIAPGPPDHTKIATMKENVKKFYRGDVVDWPRVPHFGKQLNHFFFQYSIYDQAQKALGWVREHGDVAGLERVLQPFPPINT